MPKGKWIRTTEYRKKISDSLKKANQEGRHTGFKKGVVHSQEFCEKVSKGLMGKKRKPFTQETKNKMSQSAVGRKHTDEAKRKIGLASIGRKTKGRTGQHNSEEHRRKVGEAHKGEKCHFWKGGITPINLKIKMGVDYKLWREAVFARDNWTCQECRERGNKINAHHIKPFALYPELRLALDNGRTLCFDCHKKIHKIFGKKKLHSDKMSVV